MQLFNLFCRRVAGGIACERRAKNNGGHVRQQKKSKELIGQMKRMSLYPAEQRGRKTGVLLFGAFVYAILYALGSQIDARGFTTGWETLKRFAVALPVAFLILLGIFEWLLPRIHNRHTEEEGARKPFCTLGAMVLIFLSYVPMLLVEYPGSFVYDVKGQAWQISVGQMDATHPLLHTLLMKFCLVDCYDLLQSMERGVLLYSLIQMTLVSACFAWVCASLSRSSSRRAAHFAVAFFCLFPYHMAFASNCTKDVLFSANFVLMMALAYEKLRIGRLRKFHVALYIVSGVLTCLLRNNMIYSMGAWLVVLLIGQWTRRRLLMISAIVIGLSIGINEALIMVTNAKRGNIQEVLSVPAQQLARAYQYAPQSFTKAELEDLNWFIEKNAYENYDPTIADPVKFNVNTEGFLEEPERAFRLWLSIGKKEPGIYLDAILNTALYFLYPYETYDGTGIYIEIGMTRGGNTVPHLFGQPDFVQPQRFAAIRETLDKRIFSNGAAGIPVLHWVFNAGLVIWFMLMCVLYAVYQGDKAHICVLMLPVLLWSPYLFGPVTYGRYLYPFVCILPALCAGLGARAASEEGLSHT